MFYLLICRECDDGDLVMPFDSPALRGRWATEHTRGTRHDRWFVTESEYYLSRAKVAELLAQHDRVTEKWSCRAR
jgi:hypothetical protein